MNQSDVNNEIKPIYASKVQVPVSGTSTTIQTEKVKVILPHLGKNYDINAKHYLGVKLIYSSDNIVPIMDPGNYSANKKSAYINLPLGCYRTPLFQTTADVTTNLVN
ncbi:DgyrCDS9497 [Dimorphilus gyrociliatus]|uniref:DgyrCDS9497 n=1 Tax=Dimorphilus gyrociliatus TaxID=2664684 RepID=A0A7I8VZC2_9ANNE|nr:DgyrCDS9497 [Dimorphilus gyrociliatus]